jgi:aminoglycoside phosphotransferase (APT) family kinase protein
LAGTNNELDRTKHRAALVAAAGGPRDLDAAAKGLAAWLEGRIGRNVSVANLRLPVGAGLANENLLFEASFDDDSSARGARGFVARVKPVAVQLFPDPDFDGLFRLLTVLREKALVKVPTVLWLENDPALFGAPFFIMEMLDARTPVSQPPHTTTGWLAEASPTERRVTWDTAMEAFASIHTTPGELVSFIGWPQYGETGEDQQLGYWDNYARWLDLPLSADTIALGEWVRANRPHEPGIYLSWGDARLGNMMFGADFRLAGVLDWDQMSLAHPRHDLAWWLNFNDLYSIGLGVPQPEGMGDRAATIERWEALTGLVAGDLTWHEAYVQYKLTLVSMKTFAASGDMERMRQYSPGIATRALAMLRERKRL